MNFEQDQDHRTSAGHHSTGNTFVLSSPYDVIESHRLEPPHRSRQHRTPTSPASIEVRSSNVPIFPDTPTSYDECAHLPAQIQGALVSPPTRSRFQLSMRPLTGRSRNEGDDWMLQVRVAPSRPSLRPTSVSFLPIQHSPNPAAETDRSRRAIDLGQASSHQAEPSSAAPRLPFLAKKVTSICGDIFQAADEENHSKTRLYAAPPNNVFFPQF
jgi:hypothetical protein